MSEDDEDQFKSEVGINDNPDCNLFYIHRALNPAGWKNRGIGTWWAMTYHPTSPVQMDEVVPRWNTKQSVYVNRMEAFIKRVNEQPLNEVIRMRMLKMLSPENPQMIDNPYRPCLWRGGSGDENHLSLRSRIRSFYAIVWPDEKGGLQVRLRDSGSHSEGSFTDTQQKWLHLHWDEPIRSMFRNYSVEFVRQARKQYIRRTFASLQSESADRIKQHSDVLQWISAAGYGEEVGL